MCKLKNANNQYVSGYQYSHFNFAGYILDFGTKEQGVELTEEKAKKIINNISFANTVWANTNLSIEQ